MIRATVTSLETKVEREKALSVLNNVRDLDKTRTGRVKVRINGGFVITRNPDAYKDYMRHETTYKAAARESAAEENEGGAAGADVRELHPCGTLHQRLSEEQGPGTDHVQLPAPGAPDATAPRRVRKVAARPARDLTGQQFGKWTVIEFAHISNGNRYWKCRCECGKISYVQGHSLICGTSKGCMSCRNNGRHRVIDITGQRFGSLTVIRRSEAPANDGYVHWECRCDCGRTVTVRGSFLRQGNTKNCGCGNRFQNKKKDEPIY